MHGPPKGLEVLVLGQWIQRAKAATDRALDDGADTIDRTSGDDDRSRIPIGFPARGDDDELRRG